MLSSLNSLLSSGVNKWFHPKPLMEAINGCLRTVAEPCCGSEYLTSSVFLPFGRATSGTCSIPLNKVFQEFESYAGDGIIAGADVVSGARKQGWRVKGLPKRLIAVGKAPDDLNMALIGNDFIEDDKGYIFKENPFKFGVITSAENGELISFYYMGESIVVRDFPQFNHTLGAAKTKSELEFISTLKSASPAVNGGSGRINSAITGEFSCLEDSVIDHVWVEGELKIGITRAGQLLYASKQSKTKQPGDVIVSGECLSDRGNDTGVVVIRNGVASWLRGTKDYSKYHSETVITSCLEDVTFNRYVDSYRPNTSNNTIVQHIDVDSRHSQKTNPAVNPEIKSVWVLYKANPDSDVACNVFSGMTDKDLKSIGIEQGGCLEITNLTTTVGDDDVHRIEAVGSNSKTYGKPIEPGDVVYAISLITTDNRVYKTVSINGGPVLRAQVIPIIHVSIEDTETVYGLTDLTEYWLLVEQDLDITGSTEIPEKEIV